MPNVGRMVKEASVIEFTNRLAQRSNFFITTITRLPAPEADRLRQKLFTAQGRLVLVKRRLGQRVVQGLHIAGVAELLQGSVAVVLSGEDVLQTAKVLFDFYKSHEEQLAVQGGVVDGQLLDRGGVKALAELPPKPVLLAQVIGTVESPIASVIMTVERLIGDVIRCLDQMAATRKDEPPPAAAEALAPGDTPAPTQGGTSAPAPDAGSPGAEPGSAAAPT